MCVWPYFHTVEGQIRCQPEGRRTSKRTKPRGCVYGCHMELRQQNNGSNVGATLPLLPPPPYSLVVTLTHMHAASGYTLLSGQNTECCLSACFSGMLLDGGLVLHYAPAVLGEYLTGGVGEGLLDSISK